FYLALLSIFFPYTTLFRSNSMYLYLAFIFIYQVAIQSTKFIYIFSFAFSVSAMIILYFSEAFTQLNSFLLHLPPLFGGVFLPFLDRKSTRLNSSHVNISYD